MKEKMWAFLGIFLLVSVGFVSAIENQSVCTDTDNGTNVLALGKTGSNSSGYYQDQCMIKSVDGTLGINSCSGYSCFILERYCSDDLSEVLDDLRGCPDGCSNGVCTGTVVSVGGASSCKDSDNGKDYFKKGVVETVDSYGMVLEIQSDICLKDNQNPSNSEKEKGLFEYYCDENRQIKVTEGENLYICPNGCEDGACVEEASKENSESEAKLILVKSEVITDESRLKNLDFSEYGFVSLNESEYNFIPRNSDEDEVWVYVYKTTELIKGDFEPILTKGIPSDFSFEDRGTPYFYYYQIYGETIPCDECSLTKFNFSYIYWSSNENSVIIYLPDSAILDDSEKYSEIKDLVKEYKNIYAPSEVPYPSQEHPSEEDNKEVTPSSTCQQGIRKSGSYCNENLEMISQKVAESACDNNFECESNLCIDDKCVSSGLWQKIINFFKNIFG